MKAKMTNKKGFTLVEIVAAIIILALLSVGVMNGIGFAQKMSKGNMERDAKAALVQEAIDDIAAMINYSFDDLFIEWNFELDTATNKITGDYNYIPIEIKAKEVYSGDIVLWEITGTLEFMTPNGQDSVTLKRLAGEL